MTPMLKAPGTKRLKLQYDELERDASACMRRHQASALAPVKLQYDEPPSNFAFKFNLRRYSTVYFAPYNQNNVGVLDTETNVFTTIATTVGRCKVNRCNLC